MNKVIISITVAAAVASQQLPPVLEAHGKWYLPLLTALLIGVATYLVLQFAEILCDKHKKQSDELQKNITAISQKISDSNKSVVDVLSNMQKMLSKSHEPIVDVVANLRNVIDAQTTKLSKGNGVIVDTVSSVNEQISEIKASFSQIGELNAIPQKIENLGNGIKKQLDFSLENLKNTLDASQKKLSREISAFSDNTKDIADAVKEIGETSNESAKQVHKSVEQFCKKFDQAVSPIKAAVELNDQEKKLMENLSKVFGKK